FSSIPEENLYALLIQQFGIEDVEHHVIIDGYRIDFYVKSIDTYVQLDGEYWHGLSQPYDKLTGIPKQQFDRDRLCDKHFVKNGLTMIRITDKQIKLEGNNVIKSICLSAQ